MCRVSGVSPSGPCAWRSRVRSRHARRDEQLRGEVRAIHSRWRGTCGAPRMPAELAARGQAAGRKRVARVLREQGLRGAVAARRAPRVRSRAGGRRRTWSSAGSTPRRRTGFGWPTSPACRDLGGVRVAGGGARRVPPPHREMGDGRASSHRTGPRSARQGRWATPARDGGPSLRPGHAVHLGCVRQTLSGDGGASLDRFRRRRLRQRDGGELLRHRRMRAHRGAFVSHSNQSHDGAVRLHRRWVQPAAWAFLPGLSEPQRPRARRAPTPARHERRDRAGRHPEPPSGETACPGIEHNLPLPSLAHCAHTGKSHQPSAKSG